MFFWGGRLGNLQVFVGSWTDDGQAFLAWQTSLKPQPVPNSSHRRTNAKTIAWTRRLRPVNEARARSLLPPMIYARLTCSPRRRAAEPVIARRTRNRFRRDREPDPTPERSPVRVVIRLSIRGTPDLCWDLEKGFPVR